MTKRLVRIAGLSLTIILIISSVQAMKSTLQLPSSLELTMDLDGELANESFIVTAGDTRLTNISFEIEPLKNADDDQSVQIIVDPAQLLRLGAGEEQLVQVSIAESPAVASTYNGNITVRYEEQENAEPQTIPITLTVNPAEEEEPFELNITSVPGNTAVPRAYNAPDTETSIRLLFFIAQPETADNQLDGVNLTAYVSGSHNEPVNGTSYTFKSNHEDILANGVTVPANGRQVFVELVLTNLPQSGDYSVFLVAEHEGKFVEANLANINRVTEIGDLVLSASSHSGGNSISSVEVPSEASTAVIPFYLRQTDETIEPVTNVHLQAYLLDESDTVEGGTSITFKSNGTDVSTTGITVPADGREVPVEVTISSLPSAGTYTVNLFAEQQGRVVSFSTFSLDRLETPTLTIVGSSDGNMTLKRTISAFSHDFRIASGNDTAVDDLQVIIGDFIGPDGNPVDTTWEWVDLPEGIVKTETVPGQGEAKFKITANLPQAGNYIGNIALLYANKREVTNLTVERTRPNATVEILDLGTIPGEAWNFSGFDGEMVVVLRNTGTQTMTIENVVPIRLERLEGQDGKINVLADLQYELQQNSESFQTSPDDKTIQVLLDEGTTQTPSGVEPTQPLPDVETAQTSVDEETPPILPFQLADDQTLNLTLAFEGLTVGTYEGDLIVEVDDATSPTAEKFIIQVKAPAWVAVLVIALSVIVSFFIRRWHGSGLPRRQRQRRALLQLEDLARLEKRFTDLESKEIALLEAMRTRLYELYDDPGLGTDSNADSALNEIDKKRALVPLIVETRRRIRALRPPEDFVNLAKAWVKIVDHFIANVDQDTTNQENELRTMRDTGIEDAVKTNVLAKFDKFSAAAKEQETFFPETKAWLEDVVINQRIEEGKTAANAGDIEKALADLENARKEYVAFLTEDLRRYLPTLPPGLDEATWESSRQEIEIKLLSVLNPAPMATADQLLEAYQAGYRLYLSKVISALAADIEKYRQKIDNGGKLPPDQEKALLEKLDGFLITLVGAQAHFANGRFNAAVRYYREVRDAYLHADVLPVIKKALGEKLGGKPGTKSALVGDQMPTEGTPPKAVRTGDVEREDELSRRDFRNIDEIDREIKIMQKLALGVALVLAILGGVVLLWVPNPTWGSLGDIVVAVFWGLGLYQVSNASISALGTFPGLTNFVGNITNPTNG